MDLSNTINKLNTGSELVLCALGDSLTYGWMTSKGYLDFLSEFLIASYPASNVRIINKGIPGDTAEGGLDRLRRDVTDYDPGLVLIQFGLNDVYSGYSLNRFKNNISAIVQSVVNDTSAEIILLTSVSIINPEEHKAAVEFYDAIAGAADAAGIPLCRVHEYWNEKIRSGVRHSDLVQDDGVHPTVAGYRLMAEAIMLTIKSYSKPENK